MVLAFYQANRIYNRVYGKGELLEVCVCIYAEIGEFSHSIRDMDPISNIYMLRSIVSGLKKIQLKLYSLMRYVKMFSMISLLFVKTAIHDVIFSSLIAWFYQSVGISELPYIKSHSGCKVLYIFFQYSKNDSSWQSGLPLGFSANLLVVTQAVYCLN